MTTNNTPRSVIGRRFDENYGTRPAFQNIYGMNDLTGQNLKPTDALVETGSDLMINKEPLFYDNGDVQVEVPGQFALVGHQVNSVDRVLGIVGGKYTPIDNWDIARVFDAVDYPLEWMGTPRDGKDFLMAFNLGRRSYGGDETQNYLLVHAPQDGKGRVTAMLTPVRMWCANQLTLAGKLASFKVGVGHDGNHEENLRIARYVTQQVELAQRDTDEIFNRMTQRELIEEEVGLIIDAAFSLPRIPEKVALLDNLEEDLGNSDYELLVAQANTAKAEWDYKAQRVDMVREGAWDMLKVFNSEVPTLANTPWAAYNAVTATSDWRQGRTGVEWAATFGERADEKERAFNRALAFVG